MAQTLGVPFLVPVFPRPDNITIDGTIDSHGLGRGGFETLLMNQYPKLAREDLQLISMVDDARERISSLLGICLSKKILMWGGSGSAIFASRFTALHPSRVQAVVFGANGWPIAPVTMWRDITLPYPYGISDFEELTGTSFDIDTFKSIPIYFYMGENDNNGWGFPWYIGGSDKDRGSYYDKFVKAFGSTATELLRSADEIYNSLGCSITSVLYPGVGHSITEEMNVDFIAFLNDHKLNAYSPNCLSVESDLSLEIPCAEHAGINYEFTLNYYANPTDPSGLYWKMDLNTFKQSICGECISVGNDLSLPISCAEHSDTRYGFTLRYYNNPYDPSGLYWKMDKSTLLVK